MNNSQTSFPSGKMNKTLLALLAAFALSGIGSPASAQNVRPEVGKPLQAAVEFVKAKKGKEALAKLKEAEAASDRSAYETYLIERTRGQAATSAGEAGLAARSFEAAATSSAAPANDRLPMLAAAAGQYYMAKDYAKAADVAGKYLKDGGSEAGVRTLLVQSLYLGGDLGRASKEIGGLIEAQEQQGKGASEDQLQLWVTICSKLKDAACQARALDKLLTAYPKPSYWQSAIYDVTSASNFPSRLALDVARLKLYVGTMNNTEEYFEAAQLALQEGLPTEAKKIVDKGFAAGLLGTGAEAERHRRLQNMVAKALADDDKTLGQGDAALANAKDGTPLVLTGFNYVTRGQTDKGLAMMEQGISKGGFKRPEDMTLRLGIAQALAGQATKASHTLAGVQGEGTAALAKLWSIAARKPNAAK